MKSLCCRKMQDVFSLKSGAAGAFEPGPQADALWIDFEGRTPEAGVTKNALVYPGMALARHADAGKGDVHCPVVGTVADIGPHGVMITLGAPKPKPVKAPEGETPPEPEPVVIPETQPVDLGALHGEELLAALKALGIDTAPLTRECQTLIVNGLNPEPGIAWAEPMLTTHADVIRAGLALLKRVSPAGIQVLAVADGFAPSLTGLDVKAVEPVYPASLDALVIKAVTGQEHPDGVTCLGLHALWRLGRVAQTGLPVTETVVTVASKNYLVQLGTPARALLDVAGLEAGDGDTLIFGGPLKGVAQARLQAGVSAGTYGVFLVRTEDVPPLEGDAPCIACGECVHVCPARIQPDMLSRFAELGLDDKCAAYHIDACLDCGLCSFVCIARRPVLQYLRLARGRMAGEAS